MKQMKSNIILLISVLTLISSYGQQLSKQEAVSYTLEHNYGITIAKNNINTAKNNTHILNSGYLPSLSASAGATYQNQSNTTSFGGAIDTENGEPISDRIIKGAETQRFNAAINLDYVIFDGFERHYNYKKLKESYNVT